MAPQFKDIRWDEPEPGIVVLTFNRPEVRNAVGLQMAADVISAAAEINRRADVRAVVLTGAGEQAFCAGANLKERRSLPAEQAWELVRRLKQMTTAIESIEVPVIAAVNGFALAGGTHYAISCDIRVAADHATFGLTEVKIGIIPGGPAVKLSRLMGRGKANELVLTGRWFTAEEALNMGLVEHVVPRAQLMGKALEIARQIAENAPLAVKAAKRLIQLSYESPLAVSNEYQEAVRQNLEHTDDCREGLNSFAEKRKPRFSGR
ncbi:MAG: enoyl-CoA hydratase/isomerase family protein [Rhodospirillales bacterium]|nr:enoyl-CoA hydratase/isomerase family protein [Rhodospirillales bacterium]